jgi:hypothetical protein
MENSPIDDLLSGLEDEIDRKCFKLYEKKHENLKKRLFFLACFLLLFLPAIVHFLGLSLLTICFLVMIFLAVSMFLLLPMLLVTLEVS